MSRPLAPGDRLLTPQNGRTVQLYKRPLGIDGPWEDDRCGTYAGLKAHRLHGEEPCTPCRNEEAAYTRQWRIRTGKTRHMVSVAGWHRDHAVALAVMCA